MKSQSFWTPTRRDVLGLCVSGIVASWAGANPRPRRLLLRSSWQTGNRGPVMEFGPDATFVLDLRDDERANAFLRAHELTAGQFICAVPRLRYTPYWEIRRQRVSPEEVQRRQAENERFREVDHAKL